MSTGIINIELYERQDLIHQGEKSKIIEIIDKKNVKYAAKILSLVEIEKLSRYQLIEISRGLNNILKFNHPSILKFLGYSPVNFKGRSKPVMITEFAANRSLDKILNSDDQTKLDDTKKLIILYGIASGMSFLHANNIIHRDLQPSNIFLDKYFYPKIGDFGLSREIFPVVDSIVKGSPPYISPEIYSNFEYSKSSDVYAFSIISYEIIANERPFKNLKGKSDIMKSVIEKDERPIFNEDVPLCYRQLIEKCWSKEPSLRPTFDEIVNTLKTDSNFITEKVNKEEFFKYVKFIEDSPILFDSSKKITEIEEIIKSKTNTFKKEDALSIEKIETEINFDIKRCKIGEKIVRGCFYEVFEAELDDNCQLIAKITNSTIENFFRNEMINFSREMDIILKINHPSILRIIGYSPVDSKNLARPVILCKKYTPLNEILNDERKTKNSTCFDDTIKLINIYGIAAAMSYLHSHGIIHRDLKPGNVYLDEFNHPKLSGFNLSKKIESNDSNKVIVGTPAYIAPEIYLGGNYSKNSDVYSYGIILYEIITNENPFKEINNTSELFHKYRYEHYRPNIPSNIPIAYRTLLENILNKEINERPTFDEILNELRTDRRFITDSIDEESYQEYISYLETSPKTFDSSKQIHQLDDIINSKSDVFPYLNVNIDLGMIYETETNNISLTYKPLNMQKFKQLEFISYSGLYEIYKYVDKDTGILYDAQISRSPIRYCERKELIYFSTKVNFFSKLNHPLLIKFKGYGLCYYEKMPHLLIMNEHMQNDSLEKLLKTEREGNRIEAWNDTKKLINMYGIALGMSYLHSLNILHQDVKPANIFLDEFLFPKIVDLSFAVELSDDLTEGFCGSPLFMSFEALSGKKAKSNDVFSYGITLFYILINRFPYSEYGIKVRSQLTKLIKKGIRPAINKPIPECYKQLMEKCWHQDPKERPSFEEIVYILKTDARFITETVNKEEFFEYVDFIDKKVKNIEIETPTFQKVTIQNYQKVKKKKKMHFQVNMETVDLKNFEKECRIGKGGFGAVYKVIEKETSNAFAAKVSIYELSQCTDDMIMNISREVEIISQLDHPSIMKFIGYNPNNFKSKPKPTIITEFLPNSSLDRVIELVRMNCGIDDWDDTKRLINIYGIAAGMKYIHSQDILHRDLKPANILLDEYLYPKIADFGLSKNQNNSSENDSSENDSKVNNSGFKGTYLYCAPEILFNEEYTKDGDVYAYAMIVYEIITNDLPFKGLNQYQLINQILNEQRPKFQYPIPYCYRKLITKCWSQNRHKRPSFDSIVSMIENDPSFITENVDKEEFLNYISLIKEYKSESNNKVINQVPVSINQIEKESIENEIESNFLNLNSYEKVSIISKDGTSKIYKIKDIKTGQFYQAKISLNNVVIVHEESIKLSNEVKIISQMNHPTFLKFIGFSPFDFNKKSNPVIVTEYASNGSLAQILEASRNKEIINGWNDTKKLIIIYGIASGMSYLHSNEIIHHDLCSKNIFVDEYLLPKIGDFGLSISFNKIENLAFQSTAGVKGIPFYSAPEVLQYNEYSKSSDVYAFSFIIFEIIADEIPFKNLKDNQIFNEVVIRKNRPELEREVYEKQIPEFYKKLIEKCWSQDPSERPTFDEIVESLRSEKGFLIDTVDQISFFDYVKFIEESKKAFDSSKKILRFDEFIRSNGKIKETDEEAQKIIE